jgi:uncharacterized repeat protein (TIGR01451 family)
VRIAPAGSSDVVANNVVAGNVIGLKLDGSGSLGNGNGVFVSAAATTIGGSVAGAGNVISGNPGGGIGLFNATASVIQQNKIGTTPDGHSSLANGDVGIAIGGGSGNVVGGTSAATRNLISGNAGHGVFLSSPGAGTVVRGNWIGLKADGVAPMGNKGSGVRVVSANGGLTIGGTIPPEGNRIAYNGGGGVVVESGTGTTIRTNSIHRNAGLGIDLGANGPTANDAGDSDSGPNGLLNAPVISSVSSDGTITTVQGRVSSGASGTYTVQFFSNTFADPTNQGEGQTYLGDAVVSTGAGGVVDFIATVARGVAPGRSVSAVVIESGTGNTSEYSPNVPFMPDPAADLAVTITSNAETVVAGQVVTFTVTVRNLGSNPANHVSLVSGLPAGSALFGAAPISVSQGTFSLSAGAIEAALGTIGPNGAATATIAVRPTSVGTVSVGALAYSASGDADGRNNGTTRSVSVLTAPDLSLAVAAPSSAGALQDLQYTFTVTNHGPSAATNVVVTHRLPASAAYVSSNPSQGTSTLAAGKVAANLGTVAPGSTASVTIVARPTSGGALDLEAVVALTEADPNMLNNRARTTPTVTAAPPSVIAADLRTWVARGAIRGVVMRYTGALDPVSASQASAYRITLAGRDGVLGTRDDQRVRVKSAAYDASSHSVTIAAARKLPQNMLIGIWAGGSGPSAILSASSAPIDGDWDGRAGGDFIGSLGRGRSLSYRDANGDLVKLNLRGPGSLELIRGPRGNARALVVSGANPRRSKVSGTVRKARRGGDGLTAIGTIVGLGSFRTKLKTPPFQIGPQNVSLL